MKDAVKSEWQVRPLGEVVTLNYGKALARSERDPNGRIPVYGANGVMDWSEHTLTEGPSLVIGRKGSAGEVTRVDGPFWPSDVTYYTTHDHNALDFDFLHYTLQTLNLPSMARGVKPGINRNDVYALPIPLPPLEEQQRIVAVLDEAFEGLARACAHAEANLQNSRELFERAEEVVLDADAEVDGKLVQLNHLAELRGGFAFKSKQYTETGHFVLRTVNITPDGTITRHNPKFISEDEVESHKKFALEPNDTLFVMVGATLGKTGFVQPDDLPALLNQNMWVIRAKSKEIDPHYLYHVFRRITRPAMEKATGTARGFLKRDDVRTLSFMLPPMDHQLSSVGRIVELKDRALLAEQEYKTKLQDLDDLRQSLLQKAFAGKLT